MDRGLDSFRRLQAQIGSQLGCALNLPKAKAVAVQVTLAAVVAAGALTAPQARADDYPLDQQANTQQISPDWGSAKTKIGAGIGAVAGNLFGALVGANRTVSTIVGVVGGGVIGAMEGGKDKLAEVTQAAQMEAQKAGYPKLSSERDLQMAKLQMDAVGKRVGYVEALKAAKEAEIDKNLMPNNKEAQQKYKSAVIEASKALREEKESTTSFVNAFESMLGKYDVSQYSAAHAKLRQQVNFNDASYGKLSEYAVETLMIKADGADMKAKKNDSISNQMF